MQHQRHLPATDRGRLKSSQPAGVRLALSGAERLSNVSVGGGIAATGQSRHRCAAGVAASRHAEAVEHDGLHDSQRIGSIEGIAETRLKLRRVSTAFAGAGANSAAANDASIV